MALEDKEQIILIQMVLDDVIPYNGIFQITEFQLTKYMEYYSEIFGKKGTGLKTKSNARFARRMAGLTLLKTNFNRKVKFNQLKAGLVYMIGNPQFPDHYKLGMTIELNSRLDSYQTYDPYRRFEIIKYDFVIDRALTEKKLLNHPNILKEQGEWVKKENAKEIFESICFYQK